MPPATPANAYASVPNQPGSYLNSASEVSSALLLFPSIRDQDLALAERVNLKVRKYMAKHDNSHNYEHIQRVVANAVRIWNADPARATRDWDPLVVFLACLLHDVGDHKYLKIGQSGARLKERMLVKCGASKELAHRVQVIATNVSFTNEVRNPAHVLNIMKDYPELGVVQDADRLDALGPVGQARCFAYHGAVPKFRSKSMNMAVQYMWIKLWQLPQMMNTPYGRQEAERLWNWNVQFQKEYERQIDISHVLKA